MTDQPHPFEPHPHYVEQAPLGRAFERHIQTVLAGLLIGLVAWVGITVTGNREQISRLDERLKFMAPVVEEIRQELKDRSAAIMEVPHLQTEVRLLRSETADLEEKHRDISARVTRIEERYQRGNE